MNGYLLRKCRSSEQQLMNELTKLLQARDYASKRMSELLRDLALFYVSPTLPRLPHSVLRDLTALLTHLRADKKDDLRIARLVLCFLARIVDQLELRLLHVPTPEQQQQQQPPPSSTASLDQSRATAMGLLQVLEQQELGPATTSTSAGASSPLVPRQIAVLRLYGDLCRCFGRSDALLLRLKPLLQRSPAWGLLTDARAKPPKELPGHLAQLGAAFQAARFALSPEEQRHHLLDPHLVRGAFFGAAPGASRHAAATLLGLFEHSRAHAQAVAAQLEAFVAAYRPTTLRLQDPLATVYLVRLCGQLRRLPVAKDDEHRHGSRHGSSSRNGLGAKATEAAPPPPNLLDFSFDPAPVAPAGGASPAASVEASSSVSPPPSPVARRRQRLEGLTVSGALATRLQELLLDLVEPPATASAASSPGAVVVALTALEELVLEAPGDACVRKLRGPSSLFEIAARVLERLLRDVRAAAVMNVPPLHRVLRAIQRTAEALDGSVLQQLGTGEGSGPQQQQQQPPHPRVLERLTGPVLELLTHANPFVVLASLRALLWLLPRPPAALALDDEAVKDPPQDDTPWARLQRQLLALPASQAPAESRVVLVEALLERALASPPATAGASSPPAQGPDRGLWRLAQVLTLRWLARDPCDWHALALGRLWTAALRRCPAALGPEVLGGIVEVLELHHHARPTTAERVQQATLAFLARHGAAYVVAHGDDGALAGLLVRLAPLLVLGARLTRRLVVRVLAELHAHASSPRGGREDMREAIAQLIRGLQQPPQQQQEPEPKVLASSIHSPAVREALGLDDLLGKCLEARVPTTSATTTTMMMHAPVANAFAAQPANALVSAFDGIF